MHAATSTRMNNLTSIDLFVLFDLLGHANPRIPSYFPTTHWAYYGMHRIEAQLRSTGLAATGNSQPWFVEGEKWDVKIYKGGIEDDHLPFLHRGVEILHLIPVLDPSPSPPWRTHHKHRLLDICTHCIHTFHPC
jgi:glutaminyl-peptide cyclotransferase